jgi:hypothetical protein
LIIKAKIDGGIGKCLTVVDKLQFKSVYNPSTRINQRLVYCRYLVVTFGVQLNFDSVHPLKQDFNSHLSSWGSNAIDYGGRVSARMAWVNISDLRPPEVSLLYIPE